MTPAQPQPPIQVTAWIIWFAILSGLLMMQFVIAGGLPSGKDIGQPSALQQYLPLVPALLALAIRFGLIPRISTPHMKLPAMLFGLGLAEATGILGIFLVDKAFGATKMTHFGLSVLTILTFAPVYIRAKSDQDPYQR